MKSRLLKTVFSLCLIAFLISRTNVQELHSALRSIPPGMFALFVLLNIVMVAVNSLRWKVILAAFGVNAGIINLFRYYLIGIFFNNFLPGSVGGDIYRAVGTAGTAGSKENALSAVIMERILGLLVLLPVSLTAYAFVPAELRSKGLLAGSEAALVVFLIATALMFRVDILKSFSMFYNPFFRLFERFELKDKAKNVYKVLVAFLHRKKELAAGVLLSVASRLVWIYACYLLSRSMGHGLPFLAFLLLLPLIEFVRMFPVSLNGLGVREGAFVVYLGLYGLQVPDALVLSVAVYTAPLLIGLAGGVFYAARRQG